jgi:hypothetical protein
MVKITLLSEEDKMDFGEKYLPPVQDLMWRQPQPHELVPLEEPTTSSLGIYVDHFTEGGLSLPFVPLLCDLMNATGIPLSRFNLNAIRIVHSIVELNRKLNINLGIRELLFCWGLRKTASTGCHFLAARPDSPELLMCLPDTGKGTLVNFIVVIGGNVLPAGYENFKFPCVSTMSKYFGLESLWDLIRAILTSNMFLLCRGPFPSQDAGGGDKRRPPERGLVLRSFL